MDIVVERILEWEDDPVPSASREATPPDTKPIPCLPTARAHSVRHPPVSWLVAGGAIAIAVTAFVATPTHDVSGSRTNTAPATSSVPNAFDASRTSTAELIANPFLAAPCHYLFEIASDALAIDPDGYARAALAISGTQGLTLNDVVHRDLLAAREAAAQSPARADGRASELDALDVALGRADGTPCSYHSTSPDQ